MPPRKFRARRRERSIATIALALILGFCQVFIPVGSRAGRSFQSRRLVLGGAEGGYTYFVVGNPANVARHTRPGFVLEGGGTDIDESFRWMIERSAGGDFVVIRTTGTDAYNDYILDMAASPGLGADSVATLIVTSREGSFDPFVARTIRSAEALWIAGGDQALHHARWRGTPVADAIHDLVARGVPIGGSSSGLAVMGEYTYTSEFDGPGTPHLTSAQALRDPHDPRVTVRGDFLHLPFLDGAILEPHFLQESRHGRMAVFLDQIAAVGRVYEARGIGIDRRTALLVQPDGSGRVITRREHPHGKVILFQRIAPSAVTESVRAGSVAEVKALEFGRGDEVDLSHWGGTGGTAIRLSIDGGVLKYARRNK